jgi:hypothetical protein
MIHQYSLATPNHQIHPTAKRTIKYSSRLIVATCCQAVDGARKTSTVWRTVATNVPTVWRTVATNESTVWRTVATNGVHRLANGGYKCVHRLANGGYEWSPPSGERWLRMESTVW